MLKFIGQLWAYVLKRIMYVCTLLRDLPASAPSCACNIRHVIARNTTVILRNPLELMLPLYRPVFAGGEQTKAGRRKKP
jgi:hypothetical protein